MTDTTHSYARCRGADADRFRRLGYELKDEKDGISELFDSQADYGNSIHLERLSNAGVVFYASHGSGDQYGPCVQASDGKNYVDVRSDDDCFPVVRVLRNGEVDEIGLREARRYLQVYRFAREALGELK